MIQVPLVTVPGGGIQHYSGSVDSATASRVTAARCNGDHWELYLDGEDAPELVQPDDPAPKKKK